jgi:predicted ATPase/DNA-binding SARP family transcriptional activator
MREARVQLLGEAQARVGTAAFPFLPDKRYQFLSYIAYQGDWVGRERLQFLFWPDQDMEAAQRNLRRLLGRVRELEWLNGLETYQQFLRWQVDTDVHAFRKAFQARQWEGVLAHYRGPLLAGLEGNSVDEFTNWLELERERLGQDWRTAVMKRAEELQNAGLFLDAANLLEQLLEGEELDEEALKAYMGSVVQAGGREGALKAYERFAKRLWDELKLRPTADLEQLAERIRTGEGKVSQPTVFSSVPGEAERSKQLSALPTVATSFVGRDLELAEVAEMLANPDCRLLTLTGPGGVGKTRLALKTAEQLKGNYQGVYFVPLDSLNASALIPSTIASALHLNLQGHDDPLERVTGFIKDKGLLLVLDNYEHLLDGAAVALALLRSCPNLNVLVTSRERLNLEEEWLLPLEGLAYPKDEGLTLDEGQYFDAFKLFAQRAKRVRPDFALTQETLPAVLTMCRLLEGSPLGLELAASWVRLMPPEDIAKEISRNLDFLSSSGPSKTERHSSLRAVFEYSWQRLTGAEQEALRKLSVFNGGFTREAASRVAEVPLPLLAALMDKSLLYLDSTGRYDCHALVAQYSREKLDEQPQEKTYCEEAHADYYLKLVQEQAAIIHGKSRKVAWQRTEDELDNIRSSWGWAVANTKVDVLETSAFALSDVLEGRRQEGFSLFSHAAEALDETNPAQQVALAYMMIGAAEQPETQPFNYDELSKLCKRGLALLGSEAQPRATARALRVFGCCETNVGHFGEGRLLLQEALALARQHGTPEEMGRTLCDLALLERHTSTSEEETKAFIVKAISELRDIGNLNHLSYLLLLYGAYLVYQDHLDEGERLLHESLQLAEDLGGDQEFVLYILIDLARAAHKRANFDEAERLFQEALHRSRERSKHGEAAALFLLGRVATARGSFEKARNYFKESIEIAWEYQQWMMLSAALVFVAELETAQDRLAWAAELLMVVQGLEAVEQRDRDEAQNLLDKLALHLSAAELTAAQTRGKAHVLRDLVARVVLELQTFQPTPSAGKND